MTATQPVIVVGRIVAVALTLSAKRQSDNLLPQR
jgi:hypothetical protein